MKSENFDQWNVLKKEIHKNNFKKLFKEWEVRWCSLWQNIRNESFWKWKNYRRPVLVLKKLSSDSCIAIPLSSQYKEWTWFAEYVLHWIRSIALLYQIRMISINRLTVRIWQIDENDFLKIKKRLKSLLNL
jgi:mRNA-degrading endonuclease toxin of MazEF toxin-antitoxin module